MEICIQRSTIDRVGDDPFQKNLRPTSLYKYHFPPQERRWSLSHTHSSQLKEHHTHYSFNTYDWPNLPPTTKHHRSFLPPWANHTELLATVSKPSPPKHVIHLLRPLSLPVLTRGIHKFVLFDQYCGVHHRIIVKLTSVTFTLQPFYLPSKDVLRGPTLQSKHHCQRYLWKGQLQNCLKKIHEADVWEKRYISRLSHKLPRENRGWHRFLQGGCHWH